MALIAVLLAGCLRDPGGPQPIYTPAIQVRFLGLTNGADGAKLAGFELRNVGKKPMDVSVPGFVDIGWRSGGYSGFTNKTLQPGASLQTSIPAPKDRARWRAEFICTPASEMAGSSVYSKYLNTSSEVAPR